MPFLLLLLFQHAATAPPEPASSWNFRSAINQQSLQTVLVSIEERLRALDTLYSPRYTPRWEISIEQQSRRMETIESRLGRLETLLELRLDKLSEVMSARQLKEELSKDQINRKLDSMYERLNHRLGYLEAKFDVGTAKLQSIIDAGVGRMERLETTTAGRQSEIETDLDDINTGINGIKKQLTTFEERHNRSLVFIMENGKHMVVEMDNLTSMIEDLHTELNKSHSGTEQNDDEAIDNHETMKKNMNTMIDKVTTGIDRHANNFITKANNMYNDIWRRSQLLEGLVKDSMSLSNATRRELQDGIRTIAVQMGRRGLLQSDRERQEGSLDIALDAMGLVQRRLNELGRKFDSSFQMLMLAQNLFLESCHRIQIDEPHLENKLTKVLEKILDAITNRSMSIDHEVQMLQEFMKSHSNHMTQTFGQVSNSIMQTSLQNNEDSKLLHLSIAGVKEQLLESNKYIEEVMSDIREEKATTTERLFNIASSLQELQDSVTELSNTGVKENGVKYKSDSECVDNKQLLLAILTEMQMKQLSFNNKRTNENKTEVTNKEKNSESEGDKDDIFGAEEDFDEETAEESERNVEEDEDEEEEVETTQLQHLKSINNVSEEENSEEDRIMEGSRHNSNTMLTDNSSSFQRQHRFDLQAKPNSTKDDFKPAQVTIQIIPHNINLSAENNPDPLLDLDIHQFAAIIQNSNMKTNQQRTHPTIAIVHAIPENKTNNTDVFQKNTNNFNTIPESNISNSTQANYDNGKFIYNHTEMYDGIKQSENENESLAEIKTQGNEKKQESNPSENIPFNNSSLLSKIFNTSEVNNTNSSTSTLTTKTQLMYNFTDSNSSLTDDSSKIHVPASLRRLIELYSQQENKNLTNTEFLKLLLDKNIQHNTTAYNPVQNNTENHNITRSKLQSSATLINVDTESLQNLISTLNINDEKKYEMQKQQYLNRLQELALELENRKHGLQTQEHSNVSDDAENIMSLNENEQHLK